MDKLKKLIAERNPEIKYNTIKVDTFLNQVVSTKLVKEIADEFYNYFKDKEIDKVVTVETGGVSPAIYLADKLDVDLLILKKEIPHFYSEMYSAETVSFSQKRKYTINCSVDNLKSGEKILYIDDFLANGQDLAGANDIVNQADAELVGVGIVIEKSYQLGREILDKMDVDNVSILKIKGFENNEIIWS